MPLGRSLPFDPTRVRRQQRCVGNSVSQLQVLRLADGTKVSEHLVGHRLWLEQGFNDHVFVLTGGIPQAGGGAILASGMSLAELTVRLAEDPFVVHGVVTPEIIELDTTMNDPRLAFLTG